jgi:hypothetical protein
MHFCANPRSWWWFCARQGLTRCSGREIYGEHDGMHAHFCPSHLCHTPQGPSGTHCRHRTSLEYPQRLHGGLSHRPRDLFPAISYHRGTLTATKSGVGNAPVPPHERSICALLLRKRHLALKMQPHTRGRRAWSRLAQHAHRASRVHALLPHTLIHGRQVGTT